MAVIDCEIAVIGAGPCGSFSAMTAASLGKDVVIVEEHEEVGIPDHCAGHISMSGLGRLGVVPPEAVIENEINKARLYSPSGKSLTIECDVPRVYVLNRSLFDQYLVQQAKEEGARLLLGCHAKEFYRESNVVRGVETTLGRVEAEVVVDAEGSRCSLLRKDGMPLPDRNTMLVGAQAIADRVEDVEDDTVELYFGNQYAPGFYAWIIPRRDGSGKVGLGTRRGNPRLVLDRFLQHHPIASKKIKGNLSNHSFHPIPLYGSSRKTCYDGLLMVGDVASQVKPTTGGGVIYGMVCARHAGTIAAKAVEVNDTSEGFLSNYQRLWNAELSRDLHLGHFSRRMLNRLNDRAIDRIFAVGNLFGVEDCFGSINDIDSTTNILSKAIRNPRGAATLLASLIVSAIP